MSSCECLLVLHLAVNDRGEGVLFVFLHGVPHLGDPGTGGINDVTAPLIQQLHFLNGGAKGRKDHHITGGDTGEILHPLFNGNELDIHLSQMIVHRGVVNDLVRDPETLAWVVPAGLVGHCHGTFDAPAETECFGQSNVEPTVFKPIAVVPNRADQTALVGLFEAFCHFLGTPEASPVVTLGMVEGALEGVGVHGVRRCGVTLCGLKLRSRQQKSPADRPGLRSTTVPERNQLLMVEKPA